MKQKQRASLGQTSRRKDKEAQDHSQFGSFSGSNCTRCSKLILSDSLHEESCHAHTRGSQENANGPWETGLLKEKPGLLVEIKELSPRKITGPNANREKD